MAWDRNQMAARAAQARPPQPDLRLSARDPYALRYVAATALAMALLFGSVWRVGDVVDVALGGAGQAAASGPSWEGWVEPPLYTGLPSLYLNDIAADGFSAPEGSRITIRFYGAVGDLSLTQSLGPVPANADPTAPAQDITLEQTGTLNISGPGGRSWTISAQADAPPEVVVRADVPASSAARPSVSPGARELPSGQ
jgi:hypothetical protein